jgi:hypothetical protein
MAALTVRLSDEKHARLKALAKSRGTPLNALIDEMTTLMLAEFDAETRFQARALRGHNTAISEGFRLLAKARGEEILHEPTQEYAGGEKGRKGRI